MSREADNVNSSRKRVTSTTLKEFNEKLVNDHDENEHLMLKLLQHERLYKMMENNEISKDRALWYYLKHFAQDRANQIEKLSHLPQPSHRPGRLSNSNYDADFLKKYFEEDTE